MKLLLINPNVTAAVNGPGQSEIYMRGLSATQTNNFISAGTGTFPNVAVYLDDQSAQLPGRNLDIYAADLERIEVLEGPQGTLFGAGAQAGVLRYITNKPKLDVTEGAANASYGVTAGGDPNSAINAMINLPLIPDVLGVRAVIFNDRSAGGAGEVDHAVSGFASAGVSQLAGGGSAPDSNGAGGRGGGFAQAAAGLLRGGGDAVDRRNAHNLW